MTTLALGLAPAPPDVVLVIACVLGAALAGCPASPEPADASARDAAAGDTTRLDAPSLLDVRGLDAPGLDAPGDPVDAPPSGTLSEDHPGDVGMGSDPGVIWFEDFEEGSLAAIAARYDQARDNGRWSLVTDTASGTGSALAMRAGLGEDAVDLYKELPSSDEWYVRWYARYEAGVSWHHSGMWFGGYNPPMSFPSPNAGNRPTGAERFSIAVEPVYDVGGPSPRFDFYDYWSTMHSWMAAPVVDDGTAYYGNGMVHRNDFTIDEGTWVCLEVHVRLNTAPTNGAGALLEVWKNDALMQRFDDAGPMGYWIRDKFCPEGADGRECTDFPAAFDTRLDLTFRTDANLHLNAFWPQNYITDPEMGTLTFDQMVVASRRVGCMR